jgi:sugar (pentulose or hexulose) kinase
MNCCVILDIGKTNVKLQLLDDQYRVLSNLQEKNIVISSTPYNYIDVDSIWNWFVNHLKILANRYTIQAINISAHGGAVALIDHPYSKSNQSGLVLPIMDYEWNVLESDREYLEIRPRFKETYSPLLPGGLNIGRQIFWLSKYHTEKFREAHSILMYPQYWAWRMSNTLVTEITSLGCHSDLWDVKNNTYSTMVKSLRWSEKFPPIHSASEPISRISENFANLVGMNKDCLIYSGIHDSNASYLRYLNKDKIIERTIISTGTWVISFSPHTPLEKLSEKKDMLVNIDIHGKPVACARFMGGREYESICQRLNTNIEVPVYESEIQDIINNNIMALPDFSGGSGPYPGRKGLILGSPKNGAALASLYIALMINSELELLNSSQDIVIGGALVKNVLLCRILSQLRCNQKVFICKGTTGAILGAAILCMKGNYLEAVSKNEKICEPTELYRLTDYYEKWKTKVLEHR